MKVLVIGGGGREHALAWVLSRSAAVWCSPGNPGTATCATNLPIRPDHPNAILDAMRREQIDLAVIGPEGPLAAGLADRITEAGFAVFGPSAAAAQIEASKAFAKDVMAQAGVPTARSETFTDARAALDYIGSHPEPLVVKASGLAAGKGAVVCSDRSEARAAAQEMFGGRFGEAGSEVLVEEFMEGEELSVFALTNGEHVLVLPGAQDHKRLKEGDLGPNTGGMGAYSPVSMATPELMVRIRETVLLPTLQELARRGAPYRGVLYAGLMIAPDGTPKVVEFNCRFGDPEAQVVLPICDGDLLEHMWRIGSGESWSPHAPEIAPRGAAVTTVVAAPGYPDAPVKGAAITLPDPPEDGVIFHAGTTRDPDGVLRVSGGRVLCATGFGPDVPRALEVSRGLAGAIQFEGKVFRGDIGWREVARAGVA